MAVAEGKFVLYSRIEPPLEAGTYRLTARQELSASGPKGALGTAALPVAALPTHLRVRAPRFALPPDQVLSTFPPANTEGAYGMRLPQVVIKRRTLPWERLLGGAPRAAPWLALVLIAEGEAELRTNVPAAECVTPGVVLAGPRDAEVGNCLVVRRSTVDAVFPTRLDVPLLAHAREVDVHDTELMMGDDDGFLAVVIANRLPLPGRNAAGDEVPVKYLACLVNLEGQFGVLRERAPAPAPFTVTMVVAQPVALPLADWDRVRMGAGPVLSGAPLGSIVLNALGDPVDAPRDLAGDGAAGDGAASDGDALGGDGALGARAAPGAASAPVTGLRETAAAYEAPSAWQRAAPARAAADVYAEMARPFATAAAASRVGRVIDPEYRFPVLLHWSFTSVGDTTFRALMEGLDSGLLGTVGEPPAGAPPRPAPAGRPPLEVVETGHVGLVARTRRGDAVRAWYRGPLVPHPTADPPGGRLPLAHAADQLRIVVPDGREDVSLASAFEIGRLLALARPSMVAALLRWRQTHYQTARRQAVWETQRAFLAAIGLRAPERFDPRVGTVLGRVLAGAVAARPAAFLGAPRPLADPGRPLGVDRAPDVLAAGFALPAGALRGDAAAVLDRLRDIQVPVVDRVAGVAAGRLTGAAREALGAALDRQLARLTADTLAPVLKPVTGPARPRGARAARPAPDALDRLIAALGNGHGGPDGDGAAGDGVPNDGAPNDGASNDGVTGDGAGPDSGEDA